MQTDRREIPNKTDAISIVAMIAIEIAQDVVMNARYGKEIESMSIAIFEEHMKSIAPKYKYQPCMYHIFSRNEDRKLVLHKGLFYLWFKANLATFKKLTGVPEHFKQAVDSFENLNSYLIKHQEMVRRRDNDVPMTTDDIVKESDLLWAEYKAQQLRLFSQ